MEEHREEALKPQVCGLHSRWMCYRVRCALEGVRGTEYGRTKEHAI